MRHPDDATYFITVTTWEELEDIKAFAGEDMETAKYYPEDEGYLLEFEPTVVHYEVVGSSQVLQLDSPLLAFTRQAATLKDNSCQEEASLCPYSTNSSVATSFA